LEYIATNFKVFEKSGTRSELSGGTGLSLYPVNKHYIAFIPIGEASIAVAAIIRQSRDIPAILQKDSASIRRDLQEINDRIAKGLITLPTS